MKDKELILKMLDSVNDLVQAAKSVVDNTDEVQEKPKSVKKKRGRPPKNKVEKKSEPKKVEDFTVNRNNQSKTPEFTHNKFEEMMGLDVDKPEGYDTIDDSGPRSPRTRSDYSTATMTCQECNKKFDINPIFKKDNYVCDRCIGKKFGR